MTATEKELVFDSWVKFIKNGFSFKDLSKQLYEHFRLHCHVIAYYDIKRFYEQFFSSGDETIRFIGHFDRAAMTDDRYLSEWFNAEYVDINTAMVDELEKYLPVLYAAAREKQRKADLLQAQKLLERYGLSLNDAVRVEDQEKTAPEAVQISLF